MRRFTAAFLTIILLLASSVGVTVTSFADDAVSVAVETSAPAVIEPAETSVAEISSAENADKPYLGGVPTFVARDEPEDEADTEEPEQSGIAKWWNGVVEDFKFCFIEDDGYMLLLEGILVTIKVSFAAVILGIIIGFVIALCNLSKSKLLNFVGKVYTDVIRGTPSVTQLMIIYFVVFATVQWPKWVICSIAFGINSGAYVSEIIRAGILSIDKGQTEAGRSLGLNSFQTMANIVVPQAVKNIFPTLCNEFIVLIKETAIVGYIGLMDIQKAGDFIKSDTYKAFMPLVATAVIYFVMIKILTLVLGAVEKSLRKSDIR